MNGEFCPYLAHEPRSAEGWEAWEVVNRCAGQLRTAGLGQPIGLDLATAMALAEAEGADRAVMALLLPAAEAGMIRGLAKGSGDGSP